MLEVKWLVGDEVALIGPYPSHVTLETLQDVAQITEQLLTDSTSAHVHIISDVSPVVQFPRNINAMLKTLTYLGNPRIQSITIIMRIHNPLIQIFANLIVRRITMYVVKDLDQALRTLDQQEKLSAPRS